MAFSPSLLLGTSILSSLSFPSIFSFFGNVSKKILYFIRTDGKAKAFRAFVGIHERSPLLAAINVDEVLEGEPILAFFYIKKKMVVGYKVCYS
jgi:hypothetical protein